jgi:transposase
MDVANPELLTGTVEVDETYVGGKRRGMGNRYLGNKTMVIGAIERGGGVRFQVERRTASAIVLHAFIKEAIADEAEAIYTDKHTGYRGIGDETTRHETVDHSAEEWVRADVHTNTVEGVWSLLKRSIVGSYHQLSAKHLASYLDEIAFRFNNRANPHLFRDTLVAMLDAETLTYAELIEARA